MRINESTKGGFSMCPLNPKNKCEDCNWGVPPNQGIFSNSYSCAIMEIHGRLAELSPIIQMTYSRVKEK